MKTVVLFLALCLLAQPAAACRVALILATDVSGSIDPAEYHFQMDGLAEALEDPDIADALVLGQVALMVMQWSGGKEQEVSVPWQRMLSHDAVARFANTVRKTPRRWSMSKTALGDALRFAAAEFSAVSDCRRRVLDVSGDGISNDGREILIERRRALSQNITVNGLAIDRVGRSVTEYYRRFLIGGRDAFVETATGYSDYPRAIRRKIYREVVVPSS